MDDFLLASDEPRKPANLKDLRIRLRQTRISQRDFSWKRIFLERSQAAISFCGSGRIETVMVWKRPMCPDLMIALSMTKDLEIVCAAGSMSSIRAGRRPRQRLEATRWIRMRRR